MKKYHKVIFIILIKIFNSFKMQENPYSKFIIYTYFNIKLHYLQILVRVDMDNDYRTDGFLPFFYAFYMDLLSCLVSIYLI